jgi:hypothetical protein
MTLEISAIENGTVSEVSPSHWSTSEEVGVTSLATMRILAIQGNYTQRYFAKAGSRNDSG